MKTTYDFLFFRYKRQCDVFYFIQFKSFVLENDFHVEHEIYIQSKFNC